MRFTSEISLKIRTAIKVKLAELGNDVYEELPDYIMVMVANKKSEEQMSDDLMLFLGDNTDQFTSWLHNLISKLQLVASESGWGRKAAVENDRSAVATPSETDCDRSVQDGLVPDASWATPEGSDEASASCLHSADGAGGLGSERTPTDADSTSKAKRVSRRNVLADLELESDPLICDKKQNDADIDKAAKKRKMLPETRKIKIKARNYRREGSSSAINTSPTIEDSSSSSAKATSAAIEGSFSAKATSATIEGSFSAKATSATVALVSSSVQKDRQDQSKHEDNGTDTLPSIESSELTTTISDSKPDCKVSSSVEKTELSDSKCEDGPPRADHDAAPDFEEGEIE